MKIGQVSKASGISNSTIRLYDREGLLDASGVVVERGASGARVFTDDAPEKILAIRDERAKRRNEALQSHEWTQYVTIPLVGGVSINHAYVRLHTKTGLPIRMLSASAKTWKEIARIIIVLETRYNDYLFKRSDIVRVDIGLHAFFKDKAHQSDLDNLKKILSDAIKVAIGVDDKLYNFADADPEYDKDAPRLEISITPRYLAET